MVKKYVVSLPAALIVLTLVLSACGGVQVAAGRDIEQSMYVERHTVSADSAGICVGGAVLIVFIGFCAWCLGSFGIGSYRGPME